MSGKITHTHLETNQTKPLKQLTQPFNHVGSTNQCSNSGIITFVAQPWRKRCWQGTPLRAVERGGSACHSPTCMGLAVDVTTVTTIKKVLELQTLRKSSKPFYQFKMVWHDSWFVSSAALWPQEAVSVMVACRSKNSARGVAAVPLKPPQT